MLQELAKSKAKAGDAQPNIMREEEFAKLIVDRLHAHAPSMAGAFYNQCSLGTDWTVKFLKEMITRYEINKWFKKTHPPKESTMTTTPTSRRQFSHQLSHQRSDYRDENEWTDYWDHDHGQWTDEHKGRDNATPKSGIVKNTQIAPFFDAIGSKGTKCAKKRRRGRRPCTFDTKRKRRRRRHRKRQRKRRRRKR